MVRVPIQRSYLVCATPRSGSTLLCRSLGATGVAGKPEEYFERLRHSGLPREPREYFDHAEADLLALLPETRTGDPAVTDLERELPRYLEEGTTPNGIFGTKMMWGYFGDFCARLGTAPDAPGGEAHRRIEALFGPCRYLHVTRDDKVPQAVSLWRAVQTRAWSSDDAERAAPVFDARGVEHLLRRLEAHDAAWTDWFDANGLDRHVVRYESLAGSYDATLRGVLEYLDLEAPEIPPPPINRQADDRSARWTARYRAGRPEAAGEINP